MTTRCGKMGSEIDYDYLEGESGHIIKREIEMAKSRKICLSRDFFSINSALHFMFLYRQRRKDRNELT